MATKTKPRFNGIDVLIIIIVIVCIAGIVMRYKLIDLVKTSNGEESASVSFYLSNIKSSSEDYFSEGDNFFITGTGEFLGTLESGFVFEPAEEFNETADGKYVKSASVNGRSDMRGTLRTTGTFSDEGFLLGNTKYIAPGSRLSVHSDKIEVTVTVTDIVRAE